MDWKQLLAAILPSILQMLEIAFANKPGQPSTGPIKKGAAVNFAQNTLMIAAASPELVSIGDATNTPMIAHQVEIIVQDMKRQGKLGGSKDPVPFKTLDIS